MKLAHQRQRIVPDQSPHLRLLLDLINSTLNEIFLRAGKNFLKAETPEELAAIKKEAEASIKEKIIFWRKMRGAEAISKALNSLHLSKYDI